MAEDWRPLLEEYPHDRPAYEEVWVDRPVSPPTIAETYTKGLGLNSAYERWTPIKLEGLLDVTRAIDYDLE